MKLVGVLTFVLTAAVAVLLPQPAGARIVPTNPRCSSEGGRQSLAAELPRWELDDIKFQAQGLNVDPDEYLRKELRRMCGLDPLEGPSWAIEPHHISHYEQWFGVRPFGCDSPCRRAYSLRLPEGARVCRYSFVPVHTSDGPNGYYRLAAEAFIEPADPIPGTNGGFRGFDVKIDAGGNTTFRFSDFRLFYVDQQATPEQLAAAGCDVDMNRIERVGISECAEDRSGNRWGHDCTFRRRAIGAQYNVRRRTMRKVHISKPVTDTGEEQVVLYFRDNPIRSYAAKAGFNETILNLTGTNWNDYEVRVTTTQIGANGESVLNVSTEWFRD